MESIPSRPNDLTGSSDSKWDSTTSTDIPLSSKSHSHPTFNHSTNIADLQQNLSRAKSTGNVVIGNCSMASATMQDASACQLSRGEKF